MVHGSAAAILDPRGVVRGWSEGARDLTGYPAGEVVGRPARELLIEGPTADAVADLAGTVVLRRRDGSSLALLLTAYGVNY